MGVGQTANEVSLINYKGGEKMVSVPKSAITRLSSVVINKLDEDDTLITIVWQTGTEKTYIVSTTLLTRI